MTSIRDRINEVCKLQAGWLNGEGEAITSDPAQVELVATTISEKLGVRPGIFPTIDGYVSLEWILDQFKCLTIRI